MLKIIMNSLLLSFNSFFKPFPRLKVSFYFSQCTFYQLQKYALITDNQHVGGLLRNSVVRMTDCPDMTLAVCGGGIALKQ